MTHSEGRYFQCCKCDSRFSAKSSLYVHLKKHQSKNYPNNTDSLENSSSKESYSSRASPDVQQRSPNSCDNLALETELQTEIISAETLGKSDQLIGDFNAKEENSRTLYYCPVETCTRSYTSKATLRTHVLKMHNTALEMEDMCPKTDCIDLVSSPDYIVYTPYSISQSNDQMIMVAPCDAVIFSSSETDVLPEPETSKLTSVLKRKPTQQQFIESHRTRDQGSARTGLTSADVFKLKADNSNSEPGVGATDVILGSTDLGEGLLLTEDFPSSMYFQDDIAGTECQVLLLDSGSVENTISMRDLV